MPRPPGTPKTGGRTSGTPNKSTRQLKDFLERVFTRAFSEKFTGRVKVAGDEPGEVKYVEREVSLEDLLVEQIVTQAIDGKLFTTLLAHWAGSPSRAVDVNLGAQASLAQLIAGTAPVTSPDDEDAEGGGGAS